MLYASLIAIYVYFYFSIEEYFLLSTIFLYLLFVLKNIYMIKDYIY